MFFIQRSMFDVGVFAYLDVHLFHQSLLPLYGLGQKAREIKHLHIELFSEEWVLHGAAEMDLALGARGDHYIGAGVAGLPDAFDLEGLAVRIAPGPSAVSAT